MVLRLKELFYSWRPDWKEVLYRIVSGFGLILLFGLFGCWIAYIWTDSEQGIDIIVNIIETIIILGVLDLICFIIWSINLG